MSSHSMRVEYLRQQPAKRGRLETAIGRVRAMWLARQSRRALRDLDQHLLADIGIGRGDALMEAGRPMWDLARSAR